MGSKNIKICCSDLSEISLKEKFQIFEDCLSFLIKNYYFPNYGYLEIMKLLKNQIFNNINYTSASQWALIAGNYMEKYDSKFIFLSSVAADIGRRSNYI